MRTRDLFYRVVTVMTLLAVLLPQGAAIPVRSAQAQGPIAFTEHTIADYFDYAASVYATDVDGDGDVDVLGAAPGITLPTRTLHLTDVSRCLGRAFVFG